MAHSSADHAVHTTLSPREMARQRMRFILPTAFLGGAAVLLLASIFLPYWHLRVTGPNGSDPITVVKYLNHVEGDIDGLEALGPDIGIRSIGELELIERSMSVAIVVVIALLLGAAVYVHNRYAALISLPAMLFPAIFVADLSTWLKPDDDVTAALRGTIPLLGEGRLGEHATLAGPGVGLFLAIVASALILAGLYFHRRAYKPLINGADLG